MKKNQSKIAGGIARAEKLSSERRSEIARKGAIAKHTLHKPLEAIRKGNFKEDFGFDVECYVLNDEKKTAVMNQRGMATALGIKNTSGVALTSFIRTRAIANTSLGEQLLRKINKPLIFKGLSVGVNMPPPRPANGFDVTLLIDICKAVVEARNQGSLPNTYNDVALQAEVILGATAKLGIQTLVYKLAGYDASKETVIAAFKAFVRDEAKKYEKEFPAELYIEWARLYKITPPVHGRKSWKNRHLTVDHVYHPLAQSDGKLLTLLRESKESDGGNKKLFQFLNEVGARALRIHLGRILEMAESSPDKATYEAKIADRFGGQQRIKFDT